MTRRKTYYPCDRKRLARVERKCDAILSLLDAREEDKEIDRTISLLHIQARRMKEQALREARRIRESLSSRKWR